MMKQWWQRLGVLVVWGWLTAVCQAQTFSLVQKTDSLYLLTLTTDSTSHQWTLPYPVYRMEEGDVDGNGTIEALVGVVKATRFYPEKGRRLFIFKNYGDQCQGAIHSGGIPLGRLRYGIRTLSGEKRE